jgi:hypothetical protein
MTFCKKNCNLYFIVQFYATYKSLSVLLFFARDFAIAIFGYVFKLNNHCMDSPEMYLVLFVCYLDASNSKSSNSTYLKM